MDRKFHLAQAGLWIVTLLSCIAIGLGLMVAVACFPQGPIKQHLYEAAQYGDTRASSPITTIYDKIHYTESLMLMLAGTMDDERPLESALESKTYTLTRFMQYPIRDFKEMALHGSDSMKEADYNRYWHGYLVTLRPLLFFYDLPTIRWITVLAFSILATIFLVMLKKQNGWWIAALFFLALLHAGWFKFLMFSLDQNKVYFIIFISSIILMKHRSLYLSPRFLPLFFIIIGASTSFVDFLTAPVLTLGIPLLIVFLRRGSLPVKEQILTLLTCSFAWCFGYVGMWASKWVLCSMFTDCSVYDVVKGSIKERSIGTVAIDFRLLCTRFLYPIPDVGGIWWASVAGTLVLGLTCHIGYLYMKYRTVFMHNLCYFILMLYPALWFIGTKQHTIIHLVFTYRIMGLFIIGYGIFALNTYREIRRASAKC